MDEPADQFLRKVRFLSLLTADIAYIGDEKEFYLDKVRQPVSYSFTFGDSKLIVEFDHLIDFTLKENMVIHEKIPQGRIVATRTIQYELGGVEAIEAVAPVVEETALSVEPTQDVQVEEVTEDLPQ